jgi:hypothetical protein
VLTRANIFFAPFSIHRSCMTESVTLDFTEVGVQLGQAVPFTAVPLGRFVYHATIPKADVLMHYAVMVNGEASTATQHPKEDVPVTLDFAKGTFQMQVMVATKIH